MPEPVDALEAAHQQALAEQAIEWGSYIAKDPIFVAGARAFNPGDPVPKSHVTNKVVAAEQVTSVSPAEPVVEQEPPAATEVPVPAAVEEA